MIMYNSTIFRTKRRLLYESKVQVWPLRAPQMRLDCRKWRPNFALFYRFEIRREIGEISKPSSSASVATANIGHTSSTALLHELGDLTHFFGRYFVAPVEKQNTSKAMRDHIFHFFPSCSN